MMASTMRGAFVPLDAVAGWLPEVSTRETPEDVLIAREEEEDDDAMAAQDFAAIREIAAAQLKVYLEQIPPTEALALMLHLGLLGYPPTFQDEIAEVLGVASQQIVSYMVRRARARVLYLATRPVVDMKAIARAISPAKLAVVRDVYETASFTEAARKRWTCPEDRTATQRRSWTRLHANRVKRDFFRALEKVDRRPELADQSAALRHLVEHLGSLSRHDGKGAWKKR